MKARDKTTYEAIQTYGEKKEESEKESARDNEQEQIPNTVR